MNRVWRTDQIHLDSVFSRSESRGFSRYFIVGDVTNVWAALGDLGATTSELDRFSLMGAARGVEAAFRRKGPNRSVAIAWGGASATRSQNFTTGRPNGSQKLERRIRDQGSGTVNWIGASALAASRPQLPEALSPPTARRGVSMAVATEAENANAMGPPPPRREPKRRAP